MPNQHLGVSLKSTPITRGSVAFALHCVADPRKSLWIGGDAFTNQIDTTTCSVKTGFQQLIRARHRKVLHNRVAVALHALQHPLSC